jgi:hypothetical protein
MTLFIFGLKLPIYDIGGGNKIPTNRLSNMNPYWFFWTMTRFISQFQKFISYSNDNIYHKFYLCVSKIYRLSS